MADQIGLPNITEEGKQNTGGVPPAGTGTTQTPPTNVAAPASPAKPALTPMSDWTAHLTWIGAGVGAVVAYKKHSKMMGYAMWIGGGALLGYAIHSMMKK